MEDYVSESASWLAAFFTSLLGEDSGLWGDILATLLTIFVILVVTSFVAHWGTKLIRRIVDKVGPDFSSASILINILRVVIWAIGISVILSTCFGVDVTALVTALGVGGIALSLGMQDTISNLIGGLQLSLMQVLKPGDYVTAGGVTGIVTDVAWRHVKIQDFAGNHYVIPNSTINNSTLTVHPPVRKIVVPFFFIHNGTDLNVLCDNMALAVEQALGEYGTVVDKPVIQLSSITEFGIGANIIVWMKSNENVQANLAVMKDAIIRAALPYARAVDANHVPQIAHDSKPAKSSPRKKLIEEPEEESEGFADWMGDLLERARAARRERIEKRNRRDDEQAAASDTQEQDLES